MYVTAQRVQGAQGETAVHAFVHRHDRPDCSFPEDPTTVPQDAPGRLVWRDTPEVAPGGNAVLSYLDLIVPDDRWSSSLAPQLRQLEEQVLRAELPFAVHIGELLTVFNAVEGHAESTEFKLLLEAALRALETAVTAHQP